LSVHIDNFKTIFGVKDNIQALRNKVLELAIQGKLVEQDPNDEPASELIKKIQVERTQLVKEGKIKKQKSLNLIEEDEIPFEIPKNWLFARLGDFGDWGSGATPKRGVPEYWNKGSIPWLKTGELNNSYISSSEEYITEEALNDSSVRLNKPNDILIAMYGATIGKLGILKIEATTNQACCACTTYKGIYNKYLFYSLMANKHNFINIGEGGAQPNISKDKIVNFVMPIPPIAEQHRIVVKIESLMSDIDNLEESLQKKERLTELLPKAVVEAIGSCKTGEELKEQLQFVIENFKIVFQTPESMQELRNVVLQLAIEGKLVPQDPRDEPASVLIEKIIAEKDKLISEGKIKKQKPLKAIEEDEMPFEIPESWEFVRLGLVIELLSGQDFSPDMYNDKESGIPYMTGASNFAENGLLVNRWTETPSCIAEKGDVLIVCKGSGYGKTTVCDVDKAHVARQIMSIKRNNGLNMDYANIYLKARLDEIKSRGQGVIPGIDRGSILTLIYPLPPLAEQHRIVQKVESIMTLIDQMEIELKNKGDLVKKLAV
jgi:type I restriction enzyme S subunit